MPNQTDLRDRIADAIWERCNVEGVSPRLVVDDPRNIADAVLAGLPPVSRADVLHEAANRLWALANRTTERGAGVLWAADWLRRMADEEQPVQADDRAALARRLYAVERLCSGRPGYHTITVKRLLTAMSEADEEQPATETRPSCPDPDSHNWGCGCPGDRLPLYSDRGVDTPGCDCGHKGMGMRWHATDCEWIKQLTDTARELLAEEPAVVAEQPAAADTDEEQHRG